MTPATGSVNRSNGRAGFKPWNTEIAAAPRNRTTGTSHDPYSAGHRGCHPPRNSSVATEVIVTMFAYSAIKKAAKLIELYSVWNPATSSFSASGKSNGIRLVSANAAIMNTTKEMICGKGAMNTVQDGRKPK